MKLILTCEHGGNEVPAAYKNIFTHAGAQLNSHRGYDIGALDLYKKLSPLADFSISSETTRLLIELNRSPNSKTLFSSYSNILPAQKKRELINEYYIPFRQVVEEKIRTLISGKFRVLHVSVHTFTPELNGEIRNADIGVLYDPANRMERAFSASWVDNLKKQLPGLVIRKNYPYKGTADGFTRYLRTCFPDNYMGIEIEVNQKWAVGNRMDEKIKNGIHSTLKNLSR